MTSKKDVFIGSIQDLVIIAGTDPAKVANTCEVFSELLQTLILSLDVDKTVLGKLSGKLFLHMYEGFKSFREIMLKRSAGIFTDDDVFEQISENALNMHLISATAATFGLTKNDYGNLVTSMMMASLERLTENVR